MTHKSTLSGWQKILLEFGPLLLFFVINSKYGIFTATAVFMVAFPVSMLVMWLKARHIPTISWVTGLIVLVFGGLTLYLQDETFIKLKPTLMMAGFGLFLAFDYWRGPTLMKSMMGEALPQADDGLWKPMTRNWIFFFFFMALLNEAVWRNVDTDTWVTIKTFGYLPLTLLFPLSQLPLINRHMRHDQDN